MSIPPDVIVTKTSWNGLYIHVPASCIPTLKQGLKHGVEVMANAPDGLLELYDIVVSGCNLEELKQPERK